MGKGGEGRRNEQEKPSCEAGPTIASADPQGARELEWSFRVVLSWAKMAESLYFRLEHWIWTTSESTRETTFGSSWLSAAEAVPEEAES